jgi:hypothetical protein
MGRYYHPNTVKNIGTALDAEDGLLTDLFNKESQRLVMLVVYDGHCYATDVTGDNERNYQQHMLTTQNGSLRAYFSIDRQEADAIVAATDWKKRPLEPTRKVFPNGLDDLPFKTLE